MEVFSYDMNADTLRFDLQETLATSGTFVGGLAMGSVQKIENDVVFS